MRQNASAPPEIRSETSGRRETINNRIISRLSVAGVNGEADALEGTIREKLDSRLCMLPRGKFWYYDDQGR